MTGLAIEQAAGGLVWRDSGDGIEVLLVHRPKYDDWTFPKGKLESGESLIECARREVLEEAGVRPVIGRYLGRVTYAKRPDCPKEVHYWAMEAEEVDFVPSQEVDRIKWVTDQSVADQVSYPTEERLASGLANGWREAADRILLTRHAGAGVRGGGTGRDCARPLSERGRAQAAAMVDQLEGFPIDIILTSYAARCRETVTPLAVARRRVPQLAGELWEEAGMTELRALVSDRPAGTSLLCSHRPIVQAALRILLGDRDDYVLEKGSTWVFDFVDRKLATANYLASPG